MTHNEKGKGIRKLQQNQFVGQAENRKIAPLFAGWNETMIWSCLQGVMGNLYVDDAAQPNSAAAVLGDFCFLAGAPSLDFLTFLTEEACQNFSLIVPANSALGDCIECFFEERAKRFTRYATKKDTAFDLQKLGKMAEAVPAGLTLVPIEEEIFSMAKALEWSQDLVSQYRDYEAYREKGIGTALLYQGELVAGASSYSVYKDGIEIEIDTRADWRRNGLARICGAALIQRCLDKKIYPSWDAHNKASLALAMQLGYQFDHSYTAYEIRK